MHGVNKLVLDILIRLLYVINYQNCGSLWGDFEKHAHEKKTSVTRFNLDNLFVGKQLFTSFHSS